MTLVIGLDTGGTYTDAALLDAAGGRVLATGKSLTTRDDLSIGLGGAIAKILQDFDGPASDIGMVSLSTTLATNAVVEGVGDHGCEYMTGGVAVILGTVGANFGAGMTGGMAYIYDPDSLAQSRMNMETLVTCPVTIVHWQEQLKSLISRHAEETGSPKAHDILRQWDVEKDHFLQVCPKEMLNKLKNPINLKSKIKQVS